MSQHPITFISTVDFCLLSFFTLCSPTKGLYVGLKHSVWERTILGCIKTRASVTKKCICFSANLNYYVSQHPVTFISTVGFCLLFILTLCSPAKGLYVGLKHTIWEHTISGCIMTRATVTKQMHLLLCQPELLHVSTPGIFHFNS